MTPSLARFGGAPVAQDGDIENRPKTGTTAGTGARAATGTATWPDGAARPLWGAVWPRRDFVFAAKLRQWAAQELAAGRLLPWLAVAYGFGIVIYFTASSEPVWQVAAGTACACAVCTVLLR